LNFRYYLNSGVKRSKVCKGGVNFVDIFKPLSGDGTPWRSLKISC